MLRSISVTEEVKAKQKGVNLMLEKLSVSSPNLVKKLENRQFSSRGDGSGCENTMFDSDWDSWDDNT